MPEPAPFHDRDGQIWLDGKLVPWRQANIHVLTHALHYGSAVFEGERAYGGEIFKLTEHSQRLTTARALSATRSLTRSPRSTRSAATWSRPTTFQIATSAPSPGAAGADRRLRASDEDPHGGLGLGLGLLLPDGAAPQGHPAGDGEVPPARPEDGAGKSKAAGLYMICTLEKHAAEAEGYDDALMLDWRGRIAEGTGANIFFVKDGVIRTPDPDCFLNGITRRKVIGLAKERGYKVIERAIMPDELPKFSEVFLTGTAAEVTPVSEIDQFRFKPGKISETLLNDYMATVQPARKAAE